ncbi:DUF5666 domain-containing protein [Thiolinea disciformis]|uniref:DUF5666 domain-containing protein n=1 Tax=Thiolinea disciformis TaxID=125614 RepID=UPI000375D398|nr:DUF5666 domain-containing protein [Thiolinea disciformis]
MRNKLATVVVIVSLLLTACVDTTLVAEGGMTGTGISAGRITGFGSIYVNGVHYNVDNAAFYRDGVSSNQSSFATGEFVTVSGSVNMDGMTGVATKVEFDGLVSGAISAFGTNGKTLSVLGQTIYVDLFTVLHGFDQLSDLRLGNVIQVSGTRTADGSIRASSIALLSDSYTAGDGLTVQGVVSQLQAAQKTFQMGGLTVDYTTATIAGWNGASLADLQEVQVLANQAPQGLVLKAQHIIAKVKPSYNTHSRLELEGVVTAKNSATQFTVDDQVVVTSVATRFKGLSADQIQIGLALEVNGKIDSAGVLQAALIELRDLEASNVKVIAGQITAIDQQQQTIVVEGFTLVMSNASMLLKQNTQARTLAAKGGDRHPYIKFGELVVGDYVEVNAMPLSDGTWQVLRLDRGGRVKP